MTTVRRTPAGATRTCPHCRAVILQSTSVCPSCRKHLRFQPGASGASSPTFSPLRVEGAIRNPDRADAWGDAIVVSITNDRGGEGSRQGVGGGAIPPPEPRKFTCSVEVFTPTGAERDD